LIEITYKVSRGLIMCAIAMVLFDTPLHVDALRDESKLPWHKYLKGQ